MCTGEETGIPVHVKIPVEVEPDDIKAYVMETDAYLALHQAGYVLARCVTARDDSQSGTVTDFEGTAAAALEGRRRTPNGIDAKTVGKVIRIMIDLRKQDRAAYITHGIRK